MQDFINNLLDECAKCGITDIGNEVPETVWHQGGQSTVEDTLRAAVDIGQKMFGLKPALILILLPGNGMQLFLVVSTPACLWFACKLQHCLLESSRVVLQLLHKYPLTIAQLAIVMTNTKMSMLSPFNTDLRILQFSYAWLMSACCCAQVDLFMV